MTTENHKNRTAHRRLYGEISESSYASFACLRQYMGDGQVPGLWVAKMIDRLEILKVSRYVLSGREDLIASALDAINHTLSANTLNRDIRTN